MEELRWFLKENKKKRENVTYAATKSLCDAEGKPLEWVIRPLSTRENEAILDSTTKEVKTKNGGYRPKLMMGEYIAKMIASSVVEPNLYSAALQDSYGVKTPEDLLMAMVDDPTEYQAFSEFVQTFNGVDESMEEKVEHAKN